MAYILTHGNPQPESAAIVDPTTGSPVGQWVLLSLAFSPPIPEAKERRIDELLPAPPQDSYPNYPVFFKRPGILLRRENVYGEDMHQQVGVTNGLARLEDGHLWLVTVHGDITRPWIDPDTEMAVTQRILHVFPKDATCLASGTPGGKKRR